MHSMFWSGTIYKSQRPTALLLATRQPEALIKQSLNQVVDTS